MEKNRKKTIVFGITKLDLGGAERVLVDICNSLCEQYDITIFTIYSGGALEKELSAKVKILHLYKKKKKFIPIYLLLFGRRKYNKYIKDKYDKEIAFLEGPITRLISYSSKKIVKREDNKNTFQNSIEAINDLLNNDELKKIAWVHNDIKKVFGMGIKAWIKKIVDKKVYKKFDLIAFVSKDNQKSFNELYGSDFNEGVIYNYIDKKRVLKAAEEIINDQYFAENLIAADTKKEKCFNIVPLVLTVARLTKQKAIDRFIRLHKRLMDEEIEHKVYVIGDGEERSYLEKLIYELNVESTFVLLGAKQNPYPYIKKCDIFALLSNYEGYGMVLEEAKIFEKQIVITNTAAKEAVQDYKKAVIAENNEKDIYEALKKAIKKVVER